LAVLLARGFKQDDFAKFHPAGAIGRAMLLARERYYAHWCAQCGGRASLTVKEALLLMTRAKSGSLSVVNKRGQN